ncbi:ubiquitin carboxyl-terminal hydrolase CYLD-like [Tigriopus californicus]|uniref:ubiquitin carboxyl-terminal hydrolase CYLD-like n=1 Tax=Tigriopus californicus TaxID=6832 RepID=UPI0027DAB0FD|nr:ubiquitin carboxyl-terminal hydrolase CYLD-like [Tigriopus californicus]
MAFSAHGYSGLQWTPALAPTHSLKPQTFSSLPPVRGVASGRVYDSHKPPVLVPRTYRGQYPYMLMLDCRGWRQRPGSPEQKAYMSWHGLPEQNVPKGTLVELNAGAMVAGHLNSAPVTILSLDHGPEEVRMTVLVKELIPIEEEDYLRLLPLPPDQRYELLTDEIRHPILKAIVGDTVWYCPASGRRDVGMIQYIGPVKGLSPGHWLGVELLDCNKGTSDGSFGRCRYFSAPRLSSVFGTVGDLLPYQSQASLSRRKSQNHETSIMVKNLVPSKPRIEEVPEISIYNKPYYPDRYEDHIDPARSSKGSLASNSPTTLSPVQRRPSVVDEGPQVGLNDRVVCFQDGHDPVYAVVRWIGHVPGERDFLAGVEFDNPVGVSDGTFQKKRLFKTRKNHASLLPLDSLLRAQDFSSSEDDVHKQRNKRFSLSNVPENDLNQRKVTESSTRKPRNTPSPVIHSSEGISSRTNSLNRRVLGQELPMRSPVRKSNNQSEQESPKAPDFVLGDFVERHSPQSQGPKNSNTPSPLPTPRFSPSPPPPPPRKPDSPIFDRLSPTHTSRNSEVDIGSLVEVKVNDISFFGVVRWKGWLADQDKKGVGIELEEEMIGATNGWYNGTQMFACPQRKAIFAPYSHFMLDQRFRPEVSHSLSDSDEKHFGDQECPVVPGFQEPIQLPAGDIGRICGRNRGIQGHQNSCYLDATLFAMFSFTSVFDSLLYRPQSTNDIREYNDVQRVLREEIVNPLRKNLFVRADRVMKLRKFLDHLSSVKGLTTEEKDPEEFLNSLLSQTLRASPFLQLSSGQESHLYQLFVERNEALLLPTVQELFEQSFITSNVKLKRVPSVLILQMPRFGSQFKVYDRIMPSQLLDVTDIIEDSPRQCIICGKLATHECLECYGDQSPGLDSTAFCDQCLATVHNHHKRRNHRATRLSVPDEYHSNRSTSDPTPRLFMELFAVVCIETSHYVSFVKCGLGPDAEWCFFDSMADRKGECHGYNIPEVTAALDVPKWLSDEGVESLKAQRDDKMLPTQAKRLICDAYMCFYQSPEVMMYQ